MPIVTKLLALIVLTGLSGSATANPYLLGTQDKIRVKVYDWRSATGDAHEWPGLVGEFAVNAEGSVSFPIVGDLPAAGMDTAHLASELGAKLQERVGLAQAPIASVEVLEYRPFYVLGAVGKPGEYKFRPNLTVLQALGLAGGLAKPDFIAAAGYERDVVSADGEVKTMETELSRLGVRLARLQAEVHGANAFEYKRPIVDTAFAKWLDDEKLMFGTYEHERSASLAATKTSKDFLTSEIKTLFEKDASLARESEAVERELMNVNALLARGLVPTSRQTNLDAEKSRLETERLDVQLSIARARQDIIRADSELTEAIDKSRTQILSEASEARLRQAALVEKIAVARTLESQAQDNLVTAGIRGADRPELHIFRKDRSSKMVVIRAGEQDDLLPGDTLKVDFGGANRSYQRPVESERGT